MSRRKRKKARPDRAVWAPRRRTWLVAGVGILVVGGILAAGLALREGSSPPGGGLQAPPVPGADRAPVTVLADSPPFERLNGRWLRLDGGYILEIRGAGPGRALDATYLNPRPIHVARAEATREGSTLKVFVELQAPGYPGSTYTLTYDEPRDRLEGAYFQAALGQRFDVAFVRMK